MLIVGCGGWKRLLVRDIVYKAIANNERRKILRLLRWKSLTASEIAEQFEVSNPSISRHLDILKKAELVTCRRQGKYVIYSLNMSLLQELSMEILSFCDRKKDT